MQHEILWRVKKIRYGKVVDQINDVGRVVDQANVVELPTFISKYKENERIVYSRR